VQTPERFLMGAALVASIYAGCGDDGGTGGAGGGGGAGGSDTGTSTDTGTGTGTGTGTASGTETETGTGTSGFNCELPPDCAVADPVECACLGCNGSCADAMDAPLSDCVCPECDANPFCSDPQNCEDDGVCEPLTEGCACADCVDHPAC
jgi:hypothetical protein